MKCFPGPCRLASQLPYLEEGVSPHPRLEIKLGHGMPTPWKFRVFLRESVFAALSFTAAIYLYFLTTNWGVQDYLVEGPLKQYLSNPAIHAQHLMAGTMFGVLLGAVNRLTESTWLRNRPFGLVILIRTGFYTVGVGLVFLAVAVAFLLTSVLSMPSLLQLLGSFSPRYLLSIGIWLALVATGVNFLLEIRRLVGEENLWRLLTGHYRRPRNENRVFLFMDLAASTATAERLGHRRYSEFIQECFQDLTTVALKFGGRIYQYVGDEIVMTWPTESARSRIDSVKAFFAYERILAEKGPAYEARFGVAPLFRGGIDVGPVTATEVGEVKRAIAYHGDVLNTAARLLSLCKERNGRLLVSDRVGEAVSADPFVRTGWQEELTMKGKKKPTLVYSLEPKDANPGI